MSYSWWHTYMLLSSRGRGCIQNSTKVIIEQRSSSLYLVRIAGESLQCQCHILHINAKWTHQLDNHIITQLSVNDTPTLLPPLLVCFVSSKHHIPDGEFARKATFVHTVMELVSIGTCWIWKKSKFDSWWRTKWKMHTGVNPLPAAKGNHLTWKMQRSRSCSYVSWRHPNRRLCIHNTYRTPRKVVSQMIIEIRSQ